MFLCSVSTVQVQLEDTKKAREEAYEKYMASRLGSARIYLQKMHLKISIEVLTLYLE